MTNDKLLNQEEIDLLMKSQIDEDGDSPESESEQEQPKTGSEPNPDALKPEEKDALGEIGNISMGSASTTLSELLSQKVNITSPQVSIANTMALMERFTIPYLIIKVDFVEGLDGFNLLVMQERDALIVADLMMGGEGQPEQQELTEMEISAAAEAMNMMIGTSATSLSQMFDKAVNISPPETAVLKDKKDAENTNALNVIKDDKDVVVVSFNMKIGELVDTEIMQIMGVETAQEEAALLWANLGGSDAESTPMDTEPPSEEQPDEDLDQQGVDDLINSLAGGEEQAQPPEPEPQPMEQPTYQTPAASYGGPGAPRNLDLILDIPLKVQVVLGRTKKPIKDVLNIGPGSVVELESLADEPVEILVNGTLVAEGEVVVVNENFGVKITNIISPTERIQRLAK